MHWKDIINPKNLKNMKTIRSIPIILGIIIALFAMSCENNDDVVMPEDNILPENFKVDIPRALSRNGALNAKVAVDTVDGNVIYVHLTNFIHIGESAAGITQEIIASIAIYRINRPMELSFESDEDGRVKNLVVVENSFFEGKQWEFEMTITDAESEGNEDGGKAIQVFWNRNPIEGIAILKPYNIDRDNEEEWTKAMFRIDYSENDERGYDAHMIVSISDLPLAEPLDDPYSMKTMKMFVGKKGDIVDIYGNSDHPNAVFFSGQAGFNWAFVASGDDQADVGVAEVGLPPSNLDEPNRDVLLNDYSIKNVFTEEIYSVWPSIDEDIVDAFLHNTSAPGFFNEDGFVNGGISPGPEYDALVPRLSDLSPYNPDEISNLSVTFK